MDDPSIFSKIGIWRRFRLICWQNKVGPQQERDLYKVPHRRRLGGTTTGELSRSIKKSRNKPSIRPCCFIVSRAKAQTNSPFRYPFPSPRAHSTYISRVRGETSISLDQSLIRPETPNTHKAKYAILTRALFFFSCIIHTSTVPLHPSP